MIRTIVMGLFGRSEGEDQAYQQSPNRDNEEPMEEFPPNDQKKLKRMKKKLDKLNKKK